MPNERLIIEAKKIGNHSCPKDIDLLVKLMAELSESPVVVQLGAGSGTMTLTVLACQPKAQMYSVDNVEQMFNWEQAVIDNTKAEGSRTAILAGSVEAAEAWDGPKLDLLIVDADHTHEGVLADLRAWEPHLLPDAFVFVHDYDGSMAPLQYPGVATACHEFFSDEYLWKDGWSAVWGMGKYAAIAAAKTPPKRKPKK